MALQVEQHAEKALELILKAFENPNDLPAKMAKVYLNVAERYCSRWSARNQLLVFLNGHNDAATYQTWQSRGRNVREGEHAFAILKPIMRSFLKEVDVRDDDGNLTGEKQRVKIQYLAGFEAWPVFGIEQTDVFNEELWAQYSDKDGKVQTFLDSLPWLAVADKWGLKVEAFNGNGWADGYYEHGKKIGLSAAQFQVWAHEMIHAAEDLNGTLTKARGQQPDNEVVAEVGACVLLRLAGYDNEVDLRGAWDYVCKYDADPRKTAFLLLGRITGAVARIIEEAGS